MAATRTIELKTADPGPRSREIAASGSRASVASPLAITFPIVAAAARGATLTDVDGNTFIDFAGGVGCLNVGHCAPARGRGGARAARPLHPHRLHDRPLRGLRRRSPSACSRSRRSPARSRPRSSTPAPRRSRTRSSSRAPTPAARGDRLRGRLPRPHAALARAHLEDAAVQGGPRPVRARGLPRAVPERVPRHHRRRRARRARARVHDHRRRRDRRRDRLRAGAGRGRLHRRAARVRAGLRAALRRARHRAGRRRGADRLRPHRQGSSRSSTSASSPT